MARAAEMGPMHSHSVKVSVSPVEYVDVNDPGYDLLGYLSIPNNKTEGNGELLPGVVILPDWDNVVSELETVSNAVC